MNPNRGHNQISRWMTFQAEHDARANSPRARDSMQTLMLGTLSMGLGVLTFCLTIAGLVDQPMPGWHQQESVWADIVPRQYEEVEDLFGRFVRAPRQEIVAQIWIPSGSATFMALFGLVLGAIGVIQGIPERRYSLCSVVGVVLCLLATISGVFYYFILTQLHKWIF